MVEGCPEEADSLSGVRQEVWQVPWGWELGVGTMALRIRPATDVGSWPEEFMGFWISWTLDIAGLTVNKPLTLGKGLEVQ